MELHAPIGDFVADFAGLAVRWLEFASIALIGLRFLRPRAIGARPIARFSSHARNRARMDATSP